MAKKTPSFQTVHQYKLDDQATPALRDMLGAMEGVEKGAHSTDDAFEALGAGAKRSLGQVGEELRQAQRDLGKLARAGAQGTEAFREQERAVSLLKSELKKLGGTQSLASLRQEANQLRAALSKTFDKADADAYRQQLKQVEAQMGELRHGAQETAGPLAQVRGSLVEQAQAVPGLGSGLAALANPYTAAAAAAGALVVGTGAFIKATGEAGLAIERTSQRLERLYPSEAKENLDEAASDMHALSRTFNMEVSDIQKSATAMSKAFGTDVRSSLEAVENGLLALGNEADMDELLEQAREYGVHLKDAGFSQEQMLGLLVKSSNAGIYSDKGLDAVKEFGLRIRAQTKATTDALTDAFGEKFTNRVLKGVRNGSMTAQEALAEVTQAMNRTGVNAAQLQTVVADVFGGPGEDVGLDFLKTLGQQNIEVQNLVDNTNKLTQRQKEQLAVNQEIAAAQRDFGETWAEIGPVIDLAMSRLQLLGVEAVAALSPLIQWGSDFVGWLTSARENLLVLLGPLGTLTMGIIKAGKAMGLISEDIESGNSVSNNTPNSFSSMAEYEAWKKKQAEQSNFRNAEASFDRDAYNAAQVSKTRSAEAEYAAYLAKQNGSNPALPAAGQTQGGQDTDNPLNRMVTVKAESRRPLTITQNIDSIMSGDVVIQTQTLSEGTQQAKDLVLRGLTEALNEAGQQAANQFS